MMEYYFDRCDKHIFIKSRSNHLQSKSHMEISKFDHILFSLKDPNTDEID